MKIALKNNQLRNLTKKARVDSQEKQQTSMIQIMISKIQCLSTLYNNRFLIRKT